MGYYRTGFSFQQWIILFLFPGDNKFLFIFLLIQGAILSF
jgi:hypothetical protein